MININIPDIQNSNIQPDYVKYAQFPGFVFYHSLKEWYIIYNDSSVEVRREYLLDTLNLPGSYSMLLGSNSNNIYIAQPDKAQLLKLQIDPNTAKEISKEIVDINNFFFNREISSDVAITGGFVNGNTIIILVAAVVEDISTPGGGTTTKPYIVYSLDNGGTYSFIEFNSPVSNILPTGISYINFYNTYYYVVLATSKSDDSFHVFLLEESDLDGSDTNPFQFLQTFTGHTFGSANKKYINRQLVWNHNVLYTLSEDREELLSLKTSLHSASTSYPSIYPIPPFELTTESSNLVITQIQSSEDNTVLSFALSSFLKQDTVSNGVVPSAITKFFDRYLLWDSIQENINSTVVDFYPYTDQDYISVLASETNGNITYEVSDNNLQGVQSTTNLSTISLARFNTGGEHWTGEVVDHTQEPLWDQNTTEALWISHDEDTFIIDYGTSDFDYVLQLNIDLPIAATITGDVYVDDTVTDVLVDGVSQNLSFTGSGSASLISLSLPKGPSTITFQIRNLTNQSYNPTGIKLSWNNIDLPSFPVTYSDIYTDEDEDKLYISIEPYAWVLELSTLSVIAVIDLLAEELPGGPFLIPSGVDQTAPKGKPIKWKWIKEFDDVYIYNELHDNTYSVVETQDFYNWRINPEDPSYHTMYSAFSLEASTCSHLHYFFSLSNELHAILVSRNGTSVSSSFKSTQFRLSGLANFAQVTSDPVVAGNFVTSSVFVANNGDVYLSESLGPSNYQESNTSLFVYVNNQGSDIDNGSYLVATSNFNQPYNYEGFSKWDSQPSAYNTIHPTNFDRMAKYIQIPGDYTSSSIVNSNTFKNEENGELVTTYGNSVKLSNTLVISSTEDIIHSRISNSQHWTYFLIYNKVNFRYRIVRARAVFYPTT